MFYIIITIYEYAQSGTLRHDLNGNTLDIPLTNKIIAQATYDTRNRLRNLNGLANYYHDPEDNIYAHQTIYGTTLYRHDPHGGALPRIILKEVIGGDTIAYIHGNGLQYQHNLSTGETHYYHFDHNANTMALSNENGEVTDRLDYTPYGQLIYSEGNTDTPFLFAGQLGAVTELSTGLIHMRARHYSPILQRFIQSDPIQFAGGTNWHLYAGGNPISYIDPTGLCRDNVQNTQLEQRDWFIHFDEWRLTYDPVYMMGLHSLPDGNQPARGKLGAVLKATEILINMNDVREKSQYDYPKSIGGTYPILPNSYINVPVDAKAVGIVNHGERVLDSMTREYKFFDNTPATWEEDIQWQMRLEMYNINPQSLKGIQQIRSTHEIIYDKY